jgi:hypothetical protein
VSGFGLTESFVVSGFGLTESFVVSGFGLAESFVVSGFGLAESFVVSGFGLAESFVVSGFSRTNTHSADHERTPRIACVRWLLDGHGRWLRRWRLRSVLVPSIALIVYRIVRRSRRLPCWVMLDH